MTITYEQIVDMYHAGRARGVPHCWIADDEAIEELAALVPADIEWTKDRLLGIALFCHPWPGIQLICKGDRPRPLNTAEES